MMGRILKTAEISTEVIKLIQDSREYCYLVTPYFKPWPLLERALDEAKQRQRRVTMIARVDDQKPHEIRQLEEHQKRFAFELIELNRLHIKLYVSERAAVMGSMNLFDSSQTKNHEIAYLFDDTRMARIFLHDVVEGELLLAPAVKVLKGWFSENAASERENLSKQIAALDAHGFCVVCGQKCELDRSTSPTYIRCRPCWSKAPGRDNWDLWTTFCHYCGKDHRAKGSAPMHDSCAAELKSILKSRYYKTDR